MAVWFGQHALVMHELPFRHLLRPSQHHCRLSAGVQTELTNYWFPLT